jgi:hypothetical protein
VKDLKWYEPKGPQAKLIPDPDRPGSYYYNIPVKARQRTIIRSLEPFVSEVVWELELP